MKIEDTHYSSLNDRQKKVLDKVLNPSENAFPDGISIKKYIGMTKNLMPKGSKFQEVAQQDLEHLVTLGILSKGGIGNKTKYSISSTTGTKQPVHAL